MDIRYYKEQHHNYMVIRKTEPDSRISYQQKMISSKRMENLLFANSRSLDGEEYNYYDITSLLTLTQMYGSRLFSSEDIRDLMGGVEMACDEIDRYLLDINRLCLDPDLIFYNCGKQRFLFLYNISTDPDDTASGFDTFMDWLLERVSPDDTAAGDTVYSLYELYEKGCRDIWEMVRISKEGGYASKEYEQIKSPVPESTVTSFDVEMEHDLYAETDGSPLPEIGEPPDVSSSRSKIRKNLPSFILFTLGGLIIAADIIIYMTMILNREELLVLLSTGALSIVLIVYGAIRMLISQKTGERSEEHDSLDETFSGSYDPNDIYGFEHSPNSVCMDDIVDHTPATGRRRVAVSDQFSHGVSEPGYNLEAFEDDGKTVFFDGNEDKGSYKLYAMDRKNKQHIDLSKLPCTIGKMNGYVDCCIDDPSISRIHARVDLKEDRLVLSDLNSTNGVYLNGIRLNPNEERVIETGDEIRFGSLNYCLKHCG